MTISAAQLHAVATQSGTWVSFGGTARVWLAAALLVAAGGTAYAGTRLRRPVLLRRPADEVRNLMVVAWGCAIVAFLVCLFAYANHARREHLLRAVAANHVTPVTIACAVVTFVIILTAGRGRGGPVALASAAIGAAAAPMIFEFPFDLIVMSRTYPALPPDPALYRVLFFAPLFLVELTTLALLALSPMVKVSRAAFCWFALMLVIFAVWGLIGFGYPSAPIPLTLNVTSKIIAFAVALSLFLSRRAPAAASGPGGNDLMGIAQDEPAGAVARASESWTDVLSPGGRA